jgi:hypothetical protein
MGYFVVPDRPIPCFGADVTLPGRLDLAADFSVVIPLN